MSVVTLNPNHKLEQCSRPRITRIDANFRGELPSRDREKEFLLVGGLELTWFCAGAHLEAQLVVAMAHGTILQMH